MNNLIISIILFILSGTYSSLLAQVLEIKNWCQLSCEYTDEDRKNMADAMQEMHSVRLRASVTRSYPLRFAVIDNHSGAHDLPEADIRAAIERLNESFAPVGFSFYLEQIDVIQSSYDIEDLSQNIEGSYDAFSAEHDIEDIISVYVMDHDHEYCDISPEAIRCSRTGGFSYILSTRNSNIVLSRFDLSDRKILAHEIGHFFGLYHTFEEILWGKDDFSAEGCEKLGDCLCDTPPDPGSIYEVYVNYSECEMIGLEDEEGNPYKPLINNFMNYYKPCYLRRYEWTSEQIRLMQAASQLDIRTHYAR